MWAYINHLLTLLCWSLFAVIPSISRNMTMILVLSNPQSLIISQLPIRVPMWRCCRAVLPTWCHGVELWLTMASFRNIFCELFFILMSVRGFALHVIKIHLYSSTKKYAIPPFRHLSTYYDELFCFHVYLFTVLSNNIIIANCGSRATWVKGL